MDGIKGEERGMKHHCEYESQSDSISFKLNIFARKAHSNTYFEYI